MPTVHFPRGLQQHTGGREAVAVEPARAPRVHELLAALAEQFPALAGSIDDVAVAIDGEIYQDPGYQALRPDSEVHLIPRIAGGSA
jgi:sulfur-carrier protein